MPILGIVKGVMTWVQTTKRKKLSNISAGRQRPPPPPGHDPGFAGGGAPGGKSGVKCIGERLMYR
jgi:hypothetical protein